MAHTIESVKKTQDSYTAALCSAIEKLGPLSLAGSGYSHRMGEDFSAIGAGQDGVRHATRLFTKREGLMEYGRPKIIEKSFWVWRSSYLEMEFWADFPFQLFHLERGGTTLEGVKIPDCIKADDHKISVRIFTRGFGMGKWEESFAEISRLLELAPAVQAQGLRALAEADAEVKEWREEIRKLSSLIETA